MSSKFCFRIHESYRIVFALCDSELVGKTFEEGIKQLYVRENFFKAQEGSREEVVELMKRMANEDASLNIVGKNSVDAAIEVGIINEGSIGKVQGIPFALVLL